MSENLNVRATLSATNDMSPAIRKVIADIERLKSVAKNLSTSFSSIGRAGMRSMADFDRVAKAATAQLQGMSNVSQRTARNYAAVWQRANDQRLREARSMYSMLMREERQYQSLISKRVSGSAPRGGGTSVGRIAGGTFLGVGAASAVHQLSNSVVAAERSVSRGIASAFRERLKVSKAETSGEIFGEMSKDEVHKLRKAALDRLGIKFGTGTDGALGVATELAKAGLGKEILGDATELALKAKLALDVSAENTAKLFGGLASFIAFDKARYASIANSIAIANKNSKASGEEIIEGVKRGLSAIATTGGKLTPEQLAGLVGTAIDVGIQPGKSGNFISHLVGSVGAADTMRGQRAKDMQEAAQHLGFGNRQNMAKSMRDNPLNTIYQIFDGLAKMPDRMRIRVAKDIGQEQWFDETLQMVLAKDKLKSMQKAIGTDSGFLDAAALKAIRSMAGAYASVVATAKLAQEKIGGGFDKAFTQMADAILRQADKFSFDSIKDKVQALTDGMLSVLGFRDWGQAVDWLVAKFDSGTIAAWRSWGHGFASGIKEWANSLSSAFGYIRRLTGGGDDAESAGKFAANLAGIATSLIVVNPAILLMAGALALLARPFGIFIASVYLLKKALDWVSDKIFSAFVSIVDAIKGVALATVNKVRGWMGLSPIEGSGPSRLPGETQKDFQRRIDDYTLERLKKPTSFSGATDFSGRRRTVGKDVAANLQKFTGKVERAALINGGAGISNASYGGGGGGGFIRTGGGGGGRAIGGIPSLLTNQPGTSLPGSILGSSGIIRRDRVPSFYGSGGTPIIVNPQNVPSFTGGGGSAGGGIGADLSGNAFLQARRARFAEELENDPTLRMHLAAMQATEGISQGGTIESLMNRADMQGKTLRQMLGYSADGRINPKSFYGPIRRGELGPMIERLKRNPAEFAKYDAYTNRALAGSHVIGGHTDQGLPTDPNGSARTGIPGLRLRGKSGKLDGNEFTDWVGPGSAYGRGRAGAINYRKMIEQGIAGSGSVTSSVPKPADMIQNVPTPPSIRGDASLGLQRSGGGPVAININGNSHDPEALANLVQRRIDESMNWRTHDVDSEYT